jgi:serine/threonine-protein kinase
MQPSIPIGTVLQNRYRLLKVLGQGGFGRTYLAEDLGRFNERCALKEFSPLGESDYALNKSKELFQREGATLYQIQHPQIPQFRATFEEDQRLYLVQDYVEGKTYRALLLDYKSQGKTFSEAEVLWLIQQLLPVLAHIHSKGIIHRDIAPDNIMLREQDNLPVLIDFGVVKEIATRLHAPDTQTQATTVGKMGYAPSEQMQTGRAYPNSDLYALAVTALVLRTGREPQELYDDQTLTWQWQRWATLSPGLAQVLMRMLSYRPTDRYQSAEEVITALQALTSPPPSSTTRTLPIASPNPLSSPSAAPPPPSPASGHRSIKPRKTDSRVPTVAIGQRPEAMPRPVGQPLPVERRSAATAPPTHDGSFWENPVALILTTIGLATVSGIAAWAIVSAILNSTQPTPIASPTPAPIENPTLPPTPDPPAAGEPSIVNVQLEALQPTGAIVPVEGIARANQLHNYTFTAEDGQQLSIAVEQGEVILGVLAADGNPVNEQASQFRSNWRGTLSAGDYTIQVRPRRNVPESYYRFNVALEPSEPTPSPVPSPDPSPDPSPTPDPSPVPSPDPSPTPDPSPVPSPDPSPTPDPSPDPVVDTQVLDVPIGSPLDFPGEASESVVRRYLVNVAPGQDLLVQVLQGDVVLDVRSPDGRFAQNGSRVRGWQGQFLSGGDYSIDVIANQPTTFFLRVELDGPL